MHTTHVDIKEMQAVLAECAAPPARTRMPQSPYLSALELKRLAKTRSETVMLDLLQKAPYSSSFLALLKNTSITHCAVEALLSYTPARAVLAANDSSEIRHIWNLVDPDQMLDIFQEHKITFSYYHVQPFVKGLERLNITEDKETAMRLAKRLVDGNVDLEMLLSYNFTHAFPLAREIYPYVTAPTLQMKYLAEVPGVMSMDELKELIRVGKLIPSNFREECFPNSLELEEAGPDLLMEAGHPFRPLAVASAKLKKSISLIPKLTNDELVELLAQRDMYPSINWKMAEVFAKRKAVLQQSDLHTLVQEALYFPRLAKQESLDKFWRNLLVILENSSVSPWDTFSCEDLANYMSKEVFSEYVASSVFERVPAFQHPSSFVQISSSLYPILDHIPGLFGVWSASVERSGAGRTNKDLGRYIADRTSRATLGSNAWETIAAIGPEFSGSIPDLLSVVQALET